MAYALLGRKAGMTQVFGSQGVGHAVTAIQAGPCAVLCVRDPVRDGYSAVQLGYGDKPTRLLARSERGVGGSQGVSTACRRFVKEVKLGSGHVVGQLLTVQGFVESVCVDVVGVSKGRGFAGVIKRHNFGGVCASHGVKKVHRSGGATGQSTDPGRVFKGTKMPGRLGGVRVTVKNLRVAHVDLENNLLLVRGAVPGFNGAFLTIRQ